MKKIFISYRRHDSRWQARMIYDALQRVLPRERLFMDIDSIPPGADFVEILEGWVGACEIMLALIGAGWIGAADPRTGRRRLDNPHDFVRIEIREALKRGIPVVPVLLDDASMPDADELPDDLRSLVRRQAEFVQFRTFDADVARLMRKLGVASADAMAAEARQRAAEEERQARERQTRERQAQERQAQERQAQERQAQEQKLRAEGRIPVLVGDRNASQIRRLLPGAGEPFCDVDGGPEMVVVPAGTFIMGSPDNEPERHPNEGPRHEVTFALPFAVSRYALTRGQFAAFVKATGHKTISPWRNPGFRQDDSHPVVFIRWDDAKAYAAWLAEITGRPYRLLTEAEWEYAARAGATTPFWWGSSITPEQANYKGNFVYKGGGRKGKYREGTVPVGSFDPNPWGLYNVHGNVWEWCEDTWYATYEPAPMDGSAWISGSHGSRVVRGGSWIDYPGDLRSARRIRFTDEYYSLGFRLARTLTS